MKKHSLCSVLVSGLLLMCSCTPSVNSLVTKVEKACEEGNYVEATKLIGQLEKRESEMTDEQTAKVEAAVLKLEMKTAEKAGETLKGLQDRFQ